MNRRGAADIFSYFLTGIVVVGVIVVVYILASALMPESVRVWWSHQKSDWLGLHREVRLYSDDGNVIASWTGQFKVEDRGGSARFVLDNGKAVMISGTYVVEEK